MSDLTQLLQPIRDRLAKAPALIDGRCQLCDFDTRCYRHRYGCEWSTAKVDLNTHAPADLARLLAAIERVMKEVELNTDRAFYEHCEVKIAAILSGGVK